MWDDIPRRDTKTKWKGFLGKTRVLSTNSESPLYNASIMESSANSWNWKTHKTCRHRQLHFGKHSLLFNEQRFKMRLGLSVRDESFVIINHSRSMHYAWQSIFIRWLRSLKLMINNLAVKIHAALFKAEVYNAIRKTFLILIFLSGLYIPVPCLAQLNELWFAAIVIQYACNS